MKAMVQDRYGGPDVLVLRDVEPPRVGDDDVLIRVRACGLNAADWHLMRAEPWPTRAMTGWRRPRVASPGSDVAGVVEAVGPKVTGMRPGDEVMSEVDRGGLAELVVVAADLVGPKPTNLSYEQAAVLPMAGMTALQGLRSAGALAAGQRVLVNGASGGVGHLAVQIAHAAGAEVTGVTSTRNIDLVHGIGAHHVIDYTQVDLASLGETYDVVLDAVGNQPLSACVRLLTPTGRYVAVAAGGQGRRLGAVVRRSMGMALRSLGSSRSLTGLLARRNRDDLVALRDLVESGAVTPVIDRTYQLAEAPDAIAYLEQGHARGKIVVTV